MSDNKSSRKPKKHLFLIILLSLVVVLSFDYFAVFKSLTVVQDSSWKKVLPKGYYVSLAGNLATKGYRLSVKTIKTDLTDETNLINTFSKLDTSGIVVATPVVTAAVNTLDIDLKDTLKNVTVIGIGSNNDKGLFDNVLISNTTSGWESASKNAIETKTKVAILYDNAVISEAKTIYDSLSTGSVVKINKSEYGKLFVSEIKKVLDEEKVEVIFCPHVESMSDFVSGSYTQKWITDYRYASVVEKDNLLGVVCPDLFTSLEKFLRPTLLNLDESGDYLVYEYRKVR